MAKSAKKQRLGRGLSAILNNDEIKSAGDKGAESVVGNIIEIPLNDVITNPHQPRTQFDQQAIEELAASIKQLGVIQPITVRKNKDKFDLISGERRLRASKLAGLETIPAFVRLADDREMLEMALVENIQREDLDPIEIALSFQAMIDQLNLTQDEMSKRVGKKRSTITNYLRLLRLDPIIQTGIRDGFISMGHGRALINIEDNKVQLDFYEKIIKDNLSVRQTEELVKKFREGKILSIKPAKKPVPETVKRIERDLSDIFGKKVKISMTEKGTGKISIPFTSEEDLEELKKRFL
ncbi:MAG TPA: ParB/RepB/Spo0J family partition protein [Flavobacteriales bacterium]|nr:ParB/RepB/Spo0J family partition protein [Flavobacteriales bacterium]